MSPEELEEFFAECPLLYHMAMHDSWSLIQQHGLLPTNQLLSLFEIPLEQRQELTSKRRPESVDIEHRSVGRARVRDQRPLSDAHLERCLTGGLTPQDWHDRLNERVFFWVTKQRLRTLMCARTYRQQKHLVLEIPTRPVFAAYADKIELCPMNSGCTRPFAHSRGPETFLPISEYPYKERKRKAPKGERVVEVTIIGGVPDIGKYVTRASITSCDEPEQVLYEI